LEVEVDWAGPDRIAAGHRQAHATAPREQRPEDVDRRPDPLDVLEPA
jgi:hypothetical protein